MKTRRKSSIKRLLNDRDRHFNLFLLMICLLVSTFLIISPLYPKKETKKSRLNLLLITIDTLRADRLSCYNTTHLKTPNIDSLAEKGILFSRAFANTSTTLPSHTNILLGTTPLYHGVHENANFIVREEFLTLAEHLKNFGYSTGAFVGAFPLDSRFGLNQGFDIYDDNYGTKKFQPLSYVQRKAEAVVDKALDWLSNPESPWFLWIHCFDPHDPYEPPEPFGTQYKEHLYDGEVAYVDFVLGKLFAFLKENNFFDNTLIVFTGDHGESLGQHGEMTHGYFAYNTTVWIPLIIVLPGAKQGQIEQYVSHIDIFPTVCDILGTKKPSFLQGVSLLPAMRRKRLPERPIYFESLYPYYSRGWAPLRGFILRREKFIDSPIPEFYDLDKDFEELKNLAGTKKLAKYREQLDQIIKVQSLPENIEATKKIDRETREKLRSLGYVSGSDLSLKESFEVKDDIKVFLPYHNKAMEALDIYNDGKVKEAFELLKEVITKRNDIDIAYYHLANLYRTEGKLKEAVEVLKLGHENVPSSYEIFFAYVSHLLDTGQYDEVIKVIGQKKGHQIENDPEIWNSLGAAYSNKGDFKNSIMAYKKAISIDNEYPLVFRNLGYAYLLKFLETRDPEAHQRALHNLNKAIELDPDYALAYHDLGIAYSQAGNLDEAIIHWEKALALNPDFDKTLYNLGLAYFYKGDKVKALAYFNQYKQNYQPRLSPKEQENLETLIQKCRQKE